MSYVESFARAMERARASVSYWDRKTLDHLQAAHDAEMKQLSKAEFHRGYESGVAARDADQWQLDLSRWAVVERLRKVVPSELHGSHEMLSAICKAIQEPVTGWTVGACQSLRDRLIALMGGDTDLAKTDAKMPDSGHVRECPQFPTATYDVLGNERHKAVCELRKLDLHPNTVMHNQSAVADALGVEFKEGELFSDSMRRRLIHLLGGDDETAANDDGTCPIAVQSPSITDELREFAEMFRYEWYDEKDGSSCYTTSDCPPSLDSVNMTDYINGIADRIEEQFARCCKLWERTATDTAQEVHDSMEAECNELSRDIEMWRDRAEDMRKERDELRAELRVAKHLHECNEQWCDALLDLIRDAAKDYRTAAKVARRLQERAFELRHERDELLDLLRDSAKDYQECQRLLRVFKCHVKDVRRECDDLLDKLQAISVLCEQDDG